MADLASGVADKCEVIEPLELREAVINKLKNSKYNLLGEHGNLCPCCGANAVKPLS